MQFAGVPIGPRKLAGAAIVAAGLVAFAGITLMVGLEWGLIMVAAGLGLLLLVLGASYVEARRYHRLHTQQSHAVQQSVDAVQRSADELRRRIDKVEKTVRQVAADEQVSEEVARLQQGVRSLDGMLETRLAALETIQQQTRFALAHLRAEQRRSRDADAAALRPSTDAEIELIRSSNLFDPAWYGEQVHHGAEDPIAHYVRLGASLGLDPHPLFASGWYLARHPDALERWRTPLAHFLAESDERDLDPHPTFWSRWYAEKYLGSECPDTPVEHFLRHGAADDCDPNPLFNVRWYANRYGADIPAGVNPLVHYLTVGAAKDNNPSPAFVTTEVRRRLGDEPLSKLLDLQRAGAGALPVKVHDDPTDDEGREANRRWEYLTRGLYREPDTFILYRIIGNDLPPRHREGQSLENLRFILDHEPDLPGCEKRWVVNRIVDPAAENQIIALLEERGVPYIHIPFQMEEYRNVPWHFTGFDPPGFTYRREFDKLDPTTRQRALDHVYHEKNLYVMNNNGGRNAALREGRGLAKWVLPWDGNCFVTRSAWDELVSSVTDRPYLKYFAVPMARVLDNSVLLEPDPDVEPSEEPQLLFRRDAEEEFDPNARYGRRPKVYLFYRIGLSGDWDKWRQMPWEGSRPEHRPGAGPVGHAGWVARLFSGREHLEGHFIDRGARRIEAIREKIDSIDQRLSSPTFGSDALFTLDEKILEQQRERYEAKETGLYEVISDLIARAEWSLDLPLYSVTLKTSLPPSGDPHDYWHPAPYWWPNPDTPDGRPYVRRDGMRVPGTNLREPGSEQYDRSALQSMIDETTFAALAGFFTGEERFYERGANLLRAWFLQDGTRMNPHLRYAQVRRGHNQDEGNSTGVLEVKDFYYLLDAARLIERSGALTTEDAAGLREWFRAYRRWLEESGQGRGERAALNNHGTWYDVQVAAVDAFLDNVPGVLATLRRSYERVGQQFAEDGSQPEELRRSITQHYCSYNLQGWVTLASQARKVGHDLWTYRSPQGSGLASAAQWLLRHVGRSWPYEQIDDFDTDRWVVFTHEVPADIRPSGWQQTIRGPENVDPWKVKQVFTPHDGIRPFWYLGHVCSQ